LLLVLACAVCVFAALPQSSVSNDAHIIPETPTMAVQAVSAVAEVKALGLGVAKVVSDTANDVVDNIIVASATPILGAQYPCTWGAYDLSALARSTGDYKGTDGTYDYKMNVCANSNSGTGCTDHNYAICQFSQAGGTFVASLGSFLQAPTWSLITLPGPTPTPEPSANGVSYTMVNGDICWIAGRQQVRTVISVFRCITGATGDTIDIVEDQTTCTFTITLKSPEGCPKNTGALSGGSIFLIIVVCIIPFYIGIGCVFNFKKKGTKLGMESFPNREFWADLPALIRDGARYAWNMTRSGCKNGKGEAYTQL